ncbi:MAG: hypothetical protein WDA71_07530 [Actinomycetota bacterium]
MAREKNEERLAARFDREADEAEAWGPPVERPPAEGRRTLGTQVTIRLDGEHAQVLRRLARERRIGYTSLIRQWVEDRLREECGDARDVRVVQPQTEAAGCATATAKIQVSGFGRLVERAKR